MTVRFVDGVEEEFDEVVCTFPLGVLKRAKGMFRPELPERMREAIGNIGYGALEKVYVRFERAWWLEDERQKTPELKNGNKSAEMKDDGNVMEDGKGAQYPWISDFVNPEYHTDLKAKESKTWNMGVVSLAHLPGDACQPTLLFYMHGDCGKNLTGMLEGLERGSEEYVEVIKGFAEPYYSKIEGWDAEKEDCQIRDCYATGWQRDRFAGYGGYSCFEVGLEKGDEDIECMRDGGGLSSRGKGLWFAGEHTAPFAAMGTTTGAYWSGERVARGIGQMYGLDIPVDEFSFEEGMKEVRKKNGSGEKEKSEIASNGMS